MHVLVSGEEPLLVRRILIKTSLGKPQWLLVKLLLLQLNNKLSQGTFRGLSWDRDADTFSVTLKTTQKKTTKRGVLSQLASIYDTLGLASPTSLIRKQLYHDICDNKTPWDTQLPESLVKRWRDWNSTLREDLVVPRALTPYHQPISQLTLHAFGDPSVNGVCVAVYVVVHQGEIDLATRMCKLLTGQKKSDNS